MDIRQWLRAAIIQLTRSESPKRDAEILLCHVTGLSRSAILAFDETRISELQLTQLNQLLARRVAGEPVAYITGEREFWSLALRVSPATLIPRPDTECLVELALEQLPPAARVLDLGTGTGAVALAIASERPDCVVIGVDCVAGAVSLAQQNARRLSLNATFLHSNWFSALEGQRFHLIVSNPPYIDRDDVHLCEGDVRFEPHSALVADEQGLADIRHIVSTAGDYLLPGGWLMLEHGWLQGAQVREIIQKYRFVQVETCRDYGGNERVTLAQQAC